jgi:hypothetical protein
VEESQAIIQRIYTRAAERLGSTAALARELQAPFSEIRTYMSGEAMPPEELLLRTVAVILDELPTIRRGFSQATWQSLGLPGV